MIKNSEMESKVQDRMEEIKVLLEELKAPGKSAGFTSSVPNPVESRVSQIPQMRKLNSSCSNEKQSPSASSLEKTRPSAGSVSAATGLKYHRSLRAPSRPQYQQGFACFSFKKPSSFESITDQVYAEELMASKSSARDNSQGQDSIRSKRDFGFPVFDESFQNQTVPNQRVNDYVPLRACNSSAAPHNYHAPLIKSDSTPIPPPRSKRATSLKRDQGSYANVTPEHLMYPGSKYGWSGNEPLTNGIRDNHNFSNGTTTMSTNAIEKERSPDYEQPSNHTYQANGQDYSKLSGSTGSVPLSNSSSNSNATSPKAIIRALGLFQAKAANVRSRLANWGENKERPGTKRTN